MIEQQPRVPVNPTATPFDFDLPLITAALIVAQSEPINSLTVDELPIYDHALSLARVEAHHACGSRNDCE